MRKSTKEKVDFVYPGFGKGDLKNCEYPNLNCWISG
jgi:hypothetical protein